MRAINANKITANTAMNFILLEIYCYQKNSKANDNMPERVEAFIEIDDR